MSDSSLSDAPPSDQVLEHALRHAVQVVYKTGDLEELTVKRMRKAAEGELELQEGFFKEPEWKDRSKAIIENEVVCCDPAQYPAMLSLLSVAATLGSASQCSSQFVAAGVCQSNAHKTSQEIQPSSPA